VLINNVKKIKSGLTIYFCNNIKAAIIDRLPRGLIVLPESAENIKIRDVLSMKHKNILGVNPPIHDFVFFDLWSKPAGLLYLLQRMRMNGNEIRFLDCIHDGAEAQKTFGREKISCVEIEKPLVYSGVKRKYHRFGLGGKDIAAYLSNGPRPDAVLVTSGMTYWYGGVREIITLLHQELPGVPVILGGVYARLCSEHASGLGSDFIVTEQWLPDVPYPAMDLYDRLPYGITMTSFGCPMKCSYCASHLLWPEYVRRPVKDVIAEIDFQVRLGAVDFAFYDDALLVQKRKYFYPLCRELMSRYGGSLRFHTPNGLHVREIDAECADLLKSSGFKTIRLSLESIEQSIEEAGSNKVNRELYASAVKNLRNAGYSREDCETYILLGLPGQSIESVKETISFVFSAGGKPKLAEFSPIPGTPSFAAAAAKTPEIIKEPLLHNNTVYSSWISCNIHPDELQELKNFARSAIGQ
jgi:hypothetical protein